LIVSNFLATSYQVFDLGVKFEFSVGHALGTLADVLDVFVVVALSHFVGLLEEVAAVVLLAFGGVDEAHLLQGHGFALHVPDFVREVHILLNLHFVAFVVPHVEVLLADVAQVADRDGFADLAVQQVGLLQGELLVHGGFVVTLHFGLNLTEVNMCDELACLVCNFTVQIVLCNSLFAVFHFVVLQVQQLVVHAQTVVSQRFPIGVLDFLADAEELVVTLDGLRVVENVVADDSDRELGSAFVLEFP